MEVVAAVVACTVVPLVYTSLRSYFPAKVNCWFCQHDQRVPYNQRNSFICSSCEQYNGFDASGGYNRKVPGQHCVVAAKPVNRFCTPSKSAFTRPDVVPQEGFGSNGLCDKCNREQEIIMTRIAAFEPLNEDRWNEELEDYRYKLNKIYPLCAKCTFFAQNKMQEEKKKHANLIAIKNRVANSLVSGLTSVTKVAVKAAARRRRQFFAGGRIAETLHALSFVLTILLFLPQLNQLQEDAELDLFRLPPVFCIAMPSILATAYHLVGGLLCAHTISIWTNKCRATLPDLLLPFFAALHLASFSVPEEAYREDLALFRCAFASFEMLLATAITFVPRKKMHTKRPNRILSSAFSLASTPMSQCSSQASSRNNSMLSPNMGIAAAFEESPTSTSELVIRQRLKWRERQQTPEPMTSPKQARARDDYEDMDWEPVVDSGRSAGISTNGMRPSEVMARMIRESTPSRELAPSLSTLSLLGDKRSPVKSGSELGLSTGRKVPFSNSGFGVSRSYAPSLARSRLSTAKSNVSRLPSIRSMRREDSPTRSTFTSISQREEQTRKPWITVLLVAIAVLSFLVNIALFYMMFKK
ncbi:hypothetical protein Aduo_006788 [Ancylostoma duodenale]